MPEISKKLINLTKSKLACHRNPNTLSENLANILTVAMDKKWGTDDAIYQKYREWTREDYPIQEISEYLEIANRKAETQTLITEYFPFQRDPDNNVPGTSVDQENNQRT